MRFLLVPALFTISQLGFAADPIFNYIMPDAKYMAGVDIQKAKASPFTRSILDSVPKGFFETIGLDPQRDLDEVVMASQKEGSGIAIIRGRLDSGKITGSLKLLGAVQSEMQNGVEIFRQQGNAFFLIGGHTVLVGDLESVKAAAARNYSTVPVDAVKAAKVQSLREGSDVWMITNSPNFDMKPKGGKVQNGNAGPMAGIMNGDFFKAVDQAAVGLRFTATTVDLNVEATAKTEKDAGALADVVRFLSNMVQLNRENQDVAAFATALDSMQLTQNAKVIRVKMAMPQSQLEKMMKGHGQKI